MFSKTRGEASAINVVTTHSPTTQQSVYSLTGQRLPGMQRGVNIVAGRKFMVK
jgi:hypothetical protein